MAFKIIIPYKPAPIDLRDYPFRLIEVERGSKKPKVTTFNYDDEDDIEEEIFDDVQSFNTYNDEDDYQDDDYSPVSFYDDNEDDNWNGISDETEDNRQQFDQMDIASTDWNSYDISNIIF